MLQKIKGVAGHSLKNHCCTAKKTERGKSCRNYVFCSNYAFFCFSCKIISEYFDISTLQDGDFKKWKTLKQLLSRKYVYAPKNCLNSARI